MNSSPRDSSEPLTILGLASYEKGRRFLQQAKELGCRVLLLTSLSLKDNADFPRESLDDIFYMPDRENEWNLQDMVHSVAHLCKEMRIDRVVPLDDFDLEKAALLREHLRFPGMGESATRFFRDKLAMRMLASEHDIPVPEFTATINNSEIAHFLEHVQPPWVLKPRLMAGAIGIKKYHQHQEVWDRIHSLGDEQSYFVLERFVPGDIFHVDSIWFEGRMVYAVSSAYGTPPLEVTHGGGIFTTRLLQRDSDYDKGLKWLNEKVLSSFNLNSGVSHTEFIRAHENGRIYFLETSARVGGANISDLIEAATGINMWSEWAKVEVACAKGTNYQPPEPEDDYSGLLVSLARQEWPDTSWFPEPELVWRLNKRHHVGFIVKSPDYNRVGELLNIYVSRVREQYHASAPARDKIRE
ncbi:MAG TPA: ATPase [Bryobacteraceae bacterium]|jgi:biotin carboxylase|nr:ATPase [Bryobacteraceae bacterium]